ncbi:hypothetical protein LC609_04430 [Nostoc sp. XA013]|nr:hypothetical protein [Nostoc sp. XA013]
MSDYLYGTLRDRNCSSIYCNLFERSLDCRFYVIIHCRGSFISNPNVAGYKLITI